MTLQCDYCNLRGDGSVSGGEPTCLKFRVGRVP